MNNVFEEIYLRLITEGVEEVGDAYTNLVKQVVAEKDHWDSQKKNAVEELLIGFRKVDKAGMKALEEKAAELMRTPAFVAEYAEVVAPLVNGELPIDLDAWMELQTEFADMMENPNHDARRNMLFKAADFLDDCDAKTVVKLNEMESKLRELFNKYSQF